MRPALNLSNINAERLRTHQIHVDIKPRPFAPNMNQVHHCIIDDDGNNKIFNSTVSLEHVKITSSEL